MTIPSWAVAEVERILNNTDDAEEHTPIDVIKLLELFSNSSIKNQSALLKRIQKRRALLLSAKYRERNRSRDDDDANDDTRSNSSDDSDSSSGVKANTERKQKPLVVAKKKRRIKEDDEDDVDDVVETVPRQTIEMGELPKRKLIYRREMEAKYKFLPYHSTKEQPTPLKQPMIGNVGLILFQDDVPAFTGIPISEVFARGDSKSHDVLLLATPKTLKAIPMFRNRTKISKDAIESRSLSDPIFQIAQMHHSSGAWFATRGPNSLNLFGMDRDDWQWQIRDTQPLEDDGSFLLHIDPSPFETGRIALLKRDKLMVWDVNEALIPQAICGSGPNHEFRRCCFGPHPSLIYLMSRTHLFASDQRKPKKEIISLFKQYPDSATKIDSDLLTIARVLNRRDEYCLVTRSMIMLLDIRFPGKFLCEQQHAIGFEPNDHVELMFSKRADSLMFMYGAGVNQSAPCSVVGPIPVQQTMHPHIHRERLELKMPLDEYHPNGFRLKNALSRYEPTTLQFHQLTRSFASDPKGGLHRLDGEEKKRMSPLQHFKFSSILGAGFMQPLREAGTKRDTLGIVGTSYVHVQRKPTRLDEPHLYYREIKLDEVM